VIDDVIVDRGEGAAGQALESGSDLRVRLRYSTDAPLGDVQFVIGVAGPRGIMFTANMLLDGNKLHIGSGSGVFECLFKHVPLRNHLKSSETRRANAVEGTDSNSKRFDPDRAWDPAVWGFEIISYARCVSALRRGVGRGWLHHPQPVVGVGAIQSSQRAA
jgi:hypothetical protein